jgi:hypothetical protein
VAAALAVIAPAPAGAAPPVTIAGPVESCPTPAAVAEALGAVVPAVAVAVAPAGARPASARIEDLGERYRVSVGAAERVVDDPGRDCRERARVAAIFVALTLFPPSAGAPATGPASRPATAPAFQPAAPAPTPPPAPRAAGGTEVDLPGPAAGVAARAARPRTAWRGEVAVAPLVLFAPGAAGPAATASGEVRLRGGTRRLGLALGAEVDADRDVTLTRGSARLSRYVFDLGGYAAWTRGRVGLVGDLGVALATLTARGQGVGGDASSTGRSVGVRAAAGARLWLTRRIGLGADAALVAMPRRIDLVAPPLGSLGAVPRLWVGVGLGLVAQTD